MADKNKGSSGILGTLCMGLNYIAVLVLIADFICRCVTFSKKNSDGASLAPKNPFYYLLTFYLIPFAFLILAAELEWRSVIKYVMFLKSQAGKGFFYVFIGLLIFDTKYPADIIFALYMTLVGVFNIVNAWFIPAI